MRRATVSVTSNISEGFSRNTFIEKVYFYSIALGSLTETHNQLIIAHDLKYIDDSNYKKLYGQDILVNKLLNGLIKKSLNNKRPSSYSSTSYSIS